MKKNIVLVTAILCLLATGLFIYIQILQSKMPAGGQVALMAEQPGTVGAPLVGGSFSLTNDKGQPVSEQSLVGSKFHLLFFGFANCPDVCPGMLQTMAGVMKQLPPETQNKLQMVFISVDAERDTADKLGAYVRGFYPSFIGWRGSKAAIDRMTSNYLAYYAKKPAENGADYTIDHSAMLYVMGPDGRYITHLRNSDSATFISEKLTEIVK